MKRPVPSTWLVFAGLSLIGAAPNADPEEQVRQGNAAFARGEYDSAVKLYASAEGRITDPGLVAFNTATALYRLGRYPSAEWHFRLCLQDATGPRRARVLYGLGNCLVHTAGERNVEALGEAIRCYDQCLQVEDLDPDLAADARHNLELAKLLWARARSSTPEKDPDKANGADSSSKPPPQQLNSKTGRPELVPGTPSHAGDRTAVTPEPGHQPLRTNEPPAPGTGNLPPVPDHQPLTALAPEDTAAHLRRATAQILGERREHQQQSVKPPARGVKDW